VQRGVTVCVQCQRKGDGKSCCRKDRPMLTRWHVRLTTIKPAIKMIVNPLVRARTGRYVKIESGVIVEARLCR
jgi:hypothetical protein